MKKFLKHVLWMAAVVCLLAGSMALPSRAAGSARISFSDISCQVGETFTVNMTVNATDTTLAALDAVLLYPTDYLELVSCSVPSPGSYNNAGAGTIIMSWYDATGSGKLNCSLQFRALKAGATAVTVQSQDIADTDGNIISSSAASSSITINAEKTASSDATLAALQIAPGTLSPAFSPSRTEYNIQVNNDVTKLAVTARTNDANAQFVVSGTDLEVGDNAITVRVTAEDGSTTQTYTINVRRMEAASTEEETKESSTAAESTEEETSESESETAQEGSISVTVDGQNMLIVASLDGVDLPEGYEVSDYEYDGQQIQVARSLAGGLIAFYMSDQDGDNPRFYLYDEGSQSFTRMMNIQTGARMYTVMELDDGVIIPDSYHETTVEIDGMDIRAWQSNDDMEGIYYLIYAMNWNGDRNLYRYDSEEGTMQRVDEALLVMQANEDETEMDEDLQAKLDEAESQRNNGTDKGIPGWVWYVVIGVLVLIVIVAVVLMILRNRRGGGSAGSGGSRGERQRRRREMEHDYDRDEAFEEAFGEEEEVSVSAREAEKMKTSELSSVLTEMEHEPERESGNGTGKESDDDDFEFFDL